MGGFSRTQVRSHKSRKNRKKRGAEAPLFFAIRTCPVYIAAISASPNSEHFTSLAPSIMRAKS